MQLFTNLITRCLFIKTEHRKLCTCWMCDILWYHLKIQEKILNLMAATHHKKVGKGTCLPLCIIPSSFIKSANNWELKRPAAGPNCPIPAQHRILAVHQSWVFCHIWCFSWWKVWTAGRPVQHPDFFTITKSCCCDRCSVWSSMVLIKYVRPSLK